MQAFRMYFLIACIAISSSCSAAPEKRTAYELCVPGVTRTSDGVMRVCAQLNADTVAQVERGLAAGDREIILTSGGGTTGPAMSLARLLNERKITVRARQFCLSACATYVLLSADKIVIEPYTVVAFHHTGAFALDLMSARAAPSTEPRQNQTSIQERQFFRDAGLDDTLLDRLSMAVEPTCAGVRNTSVGREGYLNYRWAWFTPNREEAEALFRGRMSGYWPSSQREVQAILRATLGDERLQVAYGWPEISESDPAMVAATLPSCPT